MRTLSLALTFVILSTFAVSTSTSFFIFDQIKERTYCKYWECCLDDKIPFNILKLHEDLSSRLFGQHIIREKLFQAVASHYKEVEKSQKPLVMSFQGTQGTGKNFVSNLVAEAVFEKGAGSQYYHVFHGSQYEDKDRVHEYKKEIKKEIFDSIDQCGYSIFVFDEVDKMPAGIFDSIKVILDYHALVKGKDFRKAMFVFLTNYGGDEITKQLYRLTNKKGIYRHQTKLHHFENISMIEVFNQKGGLEESPLIKSAVIDFYLPFLPLEEKHVAQCIRAEYKNYGRQSVSPEMIDEIMNYIGFNNVTQYANTGCKTIHPKVRSECL